MSKNDNNEMKLNVNDMFTKEEEQAFTKMLNDKDLSENGPRVDAEDVLTKKETNLLESTLQSLVGGGEVSFNAKDVESLKKIQGKLKRELLLQSMGRKRGKKKKK